jgi:quinol monooxygenase YgiN
MNIALRIGVLLAVVVAASTSAQQSSTVSSGPSLRNDKKMFGLIGRMTAVEGKRDDLIAILVNGTNRMPGCLSYIVAKDPADATTIWVTEVWDSVASHKASLTLPAVQDAIKKGRPLIAKFDQHVVTEPVGGHGLVPVENR